MDDHDLLRALAETARREEDEERERLDSRWDDLAAGTLPASEAEALRDEAGASTEGRMAWEAFTPLGDDFRSRIVAEIRSRTVSPEAAAETAPAPSPKPAAFAPRRRARWLAAGAALAATLLLFVVWPPSGEPLPGYTVRLAGGSREMRSGGTRVPEEGPPLYLPGNSFELVLTPEREAAGRLAVEAFLEHGGTVSPWPAPVEVSEHGAVRIAGRVGTEVRLPAGSSTVLVAVGRPGALPAARELIGRVRPGCSRSGKETVVCGLPVIYQDEASGGSPR